MSKPTVLTTNPARVLRHIPLALTLDQVADSLQVSKRTVEALVQTGELRSVLVGRRTRRVYQNDLLNFIKGGPHAVTKAGVRGIAARSDNEG